MRRAMESIDLGELGIGEIRSKRAATDALLLEIPGPESHARADALAGKMSILFADTGNVRIARPSKRADIRVRDLDDAATVEEVVSAVAVAEGCRPGEVRAGAIRPEGDRMGALWLQCPLEAARKVWDGGRLKVGWSSVRVEALTKRPPNATNAWSGGTSGPPAGAAPTAVVFVTTPAACDALATCPVCRDAGRPCAHRVGGPACQMGKRGSGGKGGRRRRKASDKSSPSKPPAVKEGVPVTTQAEGGPKAPAPPEDCSLLHWGRGLPR
ncbi:uncharacterized protein LOC116852223 [Odontomachus brunneus]|uniref:uncharacterized protein LOC116852223 n=1 Tax=Odontomachus brunneus TaxID=486640 RepID=UPI0013F23207|nr:uncharacterized protein LOC116852223 [Odontomachus brunneus]